NTRGGNNKRSNTKTSSQNGGSTNNQKSGSKFGSNKSYKPIKKDDKTFKNKESKPVANPKVGANDDHIRLTEYTCNSGVCARSDADLYIQSGNVTVNGQVVTEMGYKVKPTDKVVFDGVLLNPEKKVYVLLNKPKGFSTAEDENVSSAYDLVRNASTS